LSSVFLTSFVCAQYGRPAGNINPGYGGTGTSVQSGYYGYKGQYPGSTGTNSPSGYYGPKGQYPVGGPGGSDGNSEVSSMCMCTLYFITNHIFTTSSQYHWYKCITNLNFA